MEIEHFFTHKGIEYLKVYLVLYFKKFSWLKELENEFNISSKCVKKAIEILENNQMIISKDFWSLDIETQNAIKNINSAYFDKIKTYPKIYTLVKTDNDYLKMFEEEFKTLLKNDSLKASLTFIKEKSNSFNIAVQKYRNSINLDYKKDFDEKGVLYYFRTKNKINFENQIKNIVHSLEVKEKLEFKKNEITNLENKKTRLDENFIEEKIKNSNLENKKIEKSKTSIGIKKINEKNNSKNLIQNFLEEEKNNSLPFEIEDYNDTNLFKKIIGKIKSLKKLSYFKVEEELKTKNKMRSFLEFIEKDEQIFVDDDYDYFIYNFSKK